MDSCIDERAGGDKVSKLKRIVLITLALVYCFVPILNMEYQVVVEEEYVTVEPYTVEEEVQELYEELVPFYMREELRYQWVTKYRTVIKDVTKYREVTKTRPVVETQTRRVSILRYLLR